MEVSPSLTCSTLASLHTHQMNIDYGQTATAMLCSYLDFPGLNTESGRE